MVTVNFPTSCCLPRVHAELQEQSCTNLGSSKFPSAEIVPPVNVELKNKILFFQNKNKNPFFFKSNWITSSFPSIQVGTGHFRAVSHLSLPPSYKSCRYLQLLNHSIVRAPEYSHRSAQLIMPIEFMHLHIDTRLLYIKHLMPVNSCKISEVNPWFLLKLP